MYMLDDYNTNYGTLGGKGPNTFAFQEGQMEPKKFEQEYLAPTTQDVEPPKH